MGSIEMDGLDDVTDDKFSIKNGKFDVDFQISDIGGKRRTFIMSNLANELVGSDFVRKPGQNTIVLKLKKRDEGRYWYELQNSSLMPGAKQANEEYDEAMSNWDPMMGPGGKIDP